MGLFDIFKSSSSDYRVEQAKIREMEKTHTYSGVTNQWYDKKTGETTSMKEFGRMTYEDLKKRG